MPKINTNLFSIVLLGRHNPQILNHDFLMNHDILPKDQEPFKSLLAKEEKPFSNFISTPVLTSITYGDISIVVEENRFQIRETKYIDLATSTICGITKKYFGDNLKFTPCTLGGINLGGLLEFDDDEIEFENNMGINRDRIQEIAGESEIICSTKFNFSWKNGIVEVQTNRPKNPSDPSSIGFNYEFEYKNIDYFLKELDDIESIYEKYNLIIKNARLENNNG